MHLSPLNNWKTAALLFSSSLLEHSYRCIRTTAPAIVWLIRAPTKNMTFFITILHSLCGDTLNRVVFLLQCFLFLVRPLPLSSATLSISLFNTSLRIWKLPNSMSMKSFRAFVQLAGTDVRQTFSNYFIDASSHT